MIRANALRYNSCISDSTIISAAVPASVRDGLVKLAVERDRTLSAELRRAAAMYLRVEARDVQEGKP